MIIFFYFCLVSLVVPYCPNGYTYYTSTEKCYKVVEEPSIYFAAADDCSLDDGQLVSIHNAFENTYVSSIIVNKYTDHWIGLTSMINVWNFTWLDNSAFSYDRFSPSPPNRDYGCVAIKPIASTWLTESCSAQLPYVCIFDPASDRSCPVCPTFPPCPTCPPPPVCNTTANSENSMEPRNKAVMAQQNSNVICPAGYTYVDTTQRCYKVVTVGPKTFFAASNACNLDDAELLSIHSLDETQQVGALLPLYDSDKIYWIGLTNLVSNWGQWAWLDGTAVRFDNWVDEKPDFNQSCTVLHSLGLQWTTENCQLLLPYICEFDPTRNHNCAPCPDPQSCPVCPTYTPCSKPKCDDGWKYYDYTDFCYYFGNGGVNRTISGTNWCGFVGEEGNVNNTQAQEICRQKGAYLASIHSDVEDSFILNGIYATGRSARTWIGLYRTGYAAVDFANYDGTPVDYTHWAVGDPSNAKNDEYCSAMYAATPGWVDGVWDDLFCFCPLPNYVCKKPSSKN